MAKRISYNFLECAKSMPKLKHSCGKCFSVSESEVCQWLVKQTSVQQKIFDMAINSKSIVYDKQSGCWRGIEYED